MSPFPGREEPFVDPSTMPVDGREVADELTKIIGELATQLAVERVRLKYCVVRDLGGGNGGVPGHPDPGNSDVVRGPGQ